MKKNSFLTFLFAFIPGAGQMYLGMMTKGCLIMSLFSGVIFVTAFTRIELFMFALPVLWFYSFFDTLNLKNASPEEKALSEGKMFDMLKRLCSENLGEILRKRHRIAGWALVVIGSILTFNSLTDSFLGALYEYAPYVYRAINMLPTLVVSVGIIFLGVYLIRGKKPPQLEKDFIEFGGQKDEQ